MVESQGHDNEGNAPMSQAIALTLGQTFEVERFSRAIDSTRDVKELQGIAKQLLLAWQTQKAATNWVMKQQMAPIRDRLDPSLFCSPEAGINEQ